jgi:hypothetical protein
MRDLLTTNSCSDAGHSLRECDDRQSSSGRSASGLAGRNVKRFAIFAILGPCLAGATFLLVVLPMASWLEGQRIEIPLPPGRALILYFNCIFPALVVGVFDWIAGVIDVPYRPIATAIVGWILAYMVLGDLLALPDLPGWFVAIGLIGGIPAFICSWVVARISGSAATK